jgi:hypothetical protein
MVFLKPVQHPPGGGQRLDILTMAQIVARTTIAIASGMDHPLPRTDTHPEATFTLEQALPLAPRPCRHGQAVRLWPLLQRFFQERACRRIQRRWATTPRPIQQPGAPLRCLPPLPDAHAVRLHLQQSPDARQAVLLLDQHHRLRALTDSRIRIRLDQPP